MNRIRCRSAEQFQQALARIWDVEITQSDPGPIDIVMSAKRVGECLVYGGSANRTLLCTGRRSDNLWTISPITRRGTGSRYRGQQLDEGQILLLNPGGDVYQQMAAGHCQEAVSIPVDLAERIVQAEHQSSAEDLWERWCVQSNPRITTHVARILRQLLPDSGVRPAAMSTGVDLAGNIIALVQAARQVRYAPSSLALRRRIVGRGEELIRSRLDNPPSVTELCEATHASRRLLFYAFKELLGRSPNAHAKVLRLHAARRRILARKNERCVQQIGFDLGFWHPGQFAIDYAKLFGESPSKTRLDSQPAVAGTQSL
jgi:AraC family ethanolamine operon transcriptional activator